MHSIIQLGFGPHLGLEPQQCIFMELHGFIDTNKYMNRTDKIILYSVFYISVILLSCYFLWSVFFGKPTSELTREDDLNENFTGRIDSLYFERQNHNVKIGLLSDGYRYQIFRQWERYIDVGDSLSKNRKSFLLNIHKKDGEVITLDYRDTYKK